MSAKCSLSDQITNSDAIPGSEGCDPPEVEEHLFALDAMVGLRINNTNAISPFERNWLSKWCSQVGDVRAKGSEL
jgi:hypothetical protein